MISSLSLLQLQRFWTHLNLTSIFKHKTYSFYARWNRRSGGLHFFVKKLGAKFFHTLCCLSQIKKFQIIHSHSMDYTGLIIWLAFRHLTHPILQGSFFCPEFVFNYSRLTVTFISCLCHDPLSNTKGLFFKNLVWFPCVDTFFSVMVCHFKLSTLPF